jgi:NAD(P)-dependent dehydrogenase (short-subunit alcohol dehydrogenase family)
MSESPESNPVPGSPSPEDKQNPKAQPRVAIVTGGASGIGRALCEQLSTQGLTVVIADINRAGAEQVATAIQKRGGAAEPAWLDVSRECEVQKLINDIVGRHGALHYMFNNAAMAAVGELRDGNIADFRRVVDVNLFGVVHGTMAAYQVMARQGFGHIVNTASMVGLMPTPILSAYSTTKWAIIGFSTTIRIEAAALGVKVSVACPGLVRTNMGDANIYWNVRKEDHLAQLPLRWAIEPAQAARAILHGVARNQDLIVFPFSSRAAWWVYRLCPAAFAPMFRHMVNRYRPLRITK